MCRSPEAWHVVWGEILCLIYLLAATRRKPFALVDISSSTSRSIQHGSTPLQPYVYTPSRMSKSLSLQSKVIYHVGHHLGDLQLIHEDDVVAGKSLLTGECETFHGDRLSLPVLLWCPCWIQTTIAQEIFLICKHHPIFRARVRLFFHPSHSLVGAF